MDEEKNEKNETTPDIKTYKRDSGSKNVPGDLRPVRR